MVQIEGGSGKRGGGGRHIILSVLKNVLHKGKCHENLIMACLILQAGRPLPIRILFG